MRRSVLLQITWLSIACLLLGACAGNDAGNESVRAPDCLDDVDVECSPLFDPPTFDALYENTLHPTCATRLGACHSTTSREGNLAFDNPDLSYLLLLGQMDGRPRVVPGDPACSLIIERLMADSARDRMPPGDDPLPDAEICTFVRWIEDGAER